MGMRAIVVGGGIAGLASAIGLREHGWDVEVLTSFKKRCGILPPAGLVEIDG